VTERLRQFRHDGLLFDVTDSGPLDGSVIIALHGFPQLASSWAAVTPGLTDAGFRVLAFDQRGYSAGARPDNVDAYRLDRLADDVLALADAAGAATFDLLGHDWGGGVAWYLASRNPHRVRTLSVASTPHPRAMIAAMAGPQALRSWYMAVFQLPWLPEKLLGMRDGALAHRLLAGSGAPNPAAGVALLTDPPTARAAINWYRAVRLPVQPPPGRVSVPTLYVWSDEDPALGGRAALLTARWVDGPYRFEVLTGVSHWIPEERPDELARLVLGRIADPT
jgi:pimeloyl-ACP methyl ester carboxylesterase